MQPVAYLSGEACLFAYASLNRKAWVGAGLKNKLDQAYKK